MEIFLQHVLNGLNLGAIYALIALGYTMVYGILQLINFAHADVYMVGAFAAYYVARIFGLDHVPGFTTFAILLIVAMLTCAVLGYLIERLAYRPLQNAPKLNVLITAIGVSLFLEYGGQVVFGPDPKPFPTVLRDRVLFQWDQIQIHLFDVAIMAVAVGMMVVLHYLVFYTKTGRAMRAVSSKPAVASMMGVDIGKIISFTFIVGSALAGVGSVLVGMKYPQIDPLMGLLIGLKAFVAAVLGGIGNLGGAILGGLLMGLAEEMVVGYLQSSYRDALAFGILIIVLLIRPTGLLGSTQMEKV